MINVVLFQPEKPLNTGNIMRTCAATNAKLHLIRPLGFRMDERCIKSSGVNYLDKVEYFLYDDYNDICTMFSDKIDYIIESNEISSNVSSTVIEVNQFGFKVLRQGDIKIKD